MEDSNKTARRRIFNEALAMRVVGTLTPEAFKRLAEEYAKHVVEPGGLEAILILKPEGA